MRMLGVSAETILTSHLKTTSQANLYMLLCTYVYSLTKGFLLNEMRIMQKIIGVTEIQRRFRSVFDDVVSMHVPYVLTRNSRPEAVLISYEEFLRYQELEESQVLLRFDKLVNRMAAQNAAYSEEEVAADIAAARAEIER